MFSPSVRGTPRRGPLRPRDSLSVSRGTPSLFSEDTARQQPLTPSVRTSRLAVPRHIPPSPTSSAGETARTIREVDPYERVIWARDERICVASAGALPKEVQALVKKSDSTTSPISGHVDPGTGYAFVTTPTRCIAWNYQKRTHSSPTCYVFPAPASGSSYNAPCVLVSLYVSGSEPGMILVGTSGEIRIWENMSMALSTVDRYHYIDLELKEHEQAERIWSIDGTTFIITTTASTAYRLTVTSHGGRVSPSLTTIARSGRIYGSNPDIFSKAEDKVGIRSIASSQGNAYLLAGRSVQRWTISSSAIKFELEVDLYELITRSLCSRDGQQPSASVELHDIATLSHDYLAVLISESEDQSTSARSAQSYTVVLLGVSGSTLIVANDFPLSYTPGASHRALDIPRIYIPASSPTALVRFADVVVLVSLTPNDPYEDAITLRDSARNAFIGLGCQSARVSSRRPQGAPIVLMPLTGGLLSVELANNSQQATTSLDPATARLKSKMEQAVFYGDRSDNPLSFVLPPDFEGDVEEAAQAVSSDILSSNSPYMPALFELKPLLLDRLARMRELLAFIRANGLLRLLSQTSRRNLSRDAEKAKGAVELWEHQNKIMDQEHSRSPRSLLADAIAAYMDSLGLGGDDDVVRTFFRSQSSSLGKLLDLTYASFRATVSDREDLSDAGWILEINRIFLLVLRAASQYREDEVDAYEIDRAHPPTELWTAKDSIIDALEHLYHDTEKTIKDRSRILGSTIDEPTNEARDPQLRTQRHQQTLLKNQMAHLAAVLCTNMEDKIRTHLYNEASRGLNPEEGIALKARWDEMKPRVIRPLVDIDRTGEAYELAEHHSDFETLVFLCHAPSSEKGQAKVQSYIERFGEDFAFILYQWYIDQGRLYELMTQDEVYGALLTKFFDNNGYDELAWMHHISCKRYGSAAQALLLYDTQATDLAQKHLLGSIGKLAAVADLKLNGGSAPRQQILRDLDDKLETVGIQNEIRDSILQDRSRGGPVENYVAKHAQALSASRPALTALFKNLLESLVDGHNLDIEGLVDVLTLKDNLGEEAVDAVVALERMIRDSSLPESRKAAGLASIWRRIYIRDDWSIIANTRSRSEEAQRGMLRRTLAYQTFQATLDDPKFPPQFVLTPDEVTQPPLAVEIAARFPDWPADHIDSLLADHEYEVRTLQSYIDQAGLERMMKEVSELVKRDAASEEEDPTRNASEGDDVDM